MISPKERDDLLDAFDKLRLYVTEAPVANPAPKFKDNCGNCGHYNRTDDNCGKFKRVPPMKVILNGCSEWDLDIPF